MGGGWLWREDGIGDAICSHAEEELNKEQARRLMREADAHIVLTNAKTCAFILTLACQALK